MYAIKDCWGFYIYLYACMYILPFLFAISISKLWWIHINTEWFPFSPCSCRTNYALRLWFGLVVSLIVFLTYIMCLMILLHRSGFQPKRSLEVILFTSEEPTRFGISCLGRSLLILAVVCWLLCLYCSIYLTVIRDVEFYSISLISLNMYKNSSSVWLVVAYLCKNYCDYIEFVLCLKCAVAY